MQNRLLLVEVKNVLWRAVGHHIHNASARRIPPEGFGLVPDEPDVKNRFAMFRLDLVCSRISDAAGLRPDFRCGRASAKFQMRLDFGQMQWGEVGSKNVTLKDVTRQVQL